jgi:uncharacterized protein
MDASIVVSVLLSAAIGVALGLFGGGGSVLAVPMLVLVVGLPPSAAVGTSLAMVGTTSLVAGHAHFRRGHVLPRVALLFGLSGLLTAFLGAKLTALVPGSIIMHSFAILMLVVGAGMLFGRARATGVEAAAIRPAPKLGRSIGAGAGVGFITGFMGVGGGFLVVPALIAFAGLDTRQAVGTSLWVIAINSAAGFVGHLDVGRISFGLVGILTSAATVGALVGERVARGVATTKLRRSFGLLVIAVGITVVTTSTIKANAVRSHEQGVQSL